MMLIATGKCHTCGNESWVDECAECLKARQYEQRTFLDLKGALERLCRAQTHLPDHSCTSGAHVTARSDSRRRANQKRRATAARFKAAKRRQTHRAPKQRKRRAVDE